MQLNEASALAIALISKYGLHEWSFRFNKNKRRLGVCKQTQKFIELSEHYVLRNNEAHVKDTILHEVAHAIVGTEHGHDQTWKDMCLLVGCKAKSCDSSAEMPEGAWQARCPGCLSIFARHRRPKRLRGRYCVGCGPERGKLVFADTRLVAAKEMPTDVSARQLSLSFQFG